MGPLKGKQFIKSAEYEDKEHRSMKNTNMIAHRRVYVGSPQLRKVGLLLMVLLTMMNN